MREYSEMITGMFLVSFIFFVALASFALTSGYYLVKPDACIPMIEDIDEDNGIIAGHGRSSCSLRK